jgi:hypothetical protein
MKRGIAIVVLLAAAATHSTRARSSEKPESASPRGSGDASALEVKDLEQTLRQASLKGNVAFFEKHWADDYIRTNSFGVYLKKEDALTNYRSGALKYQKLEFNDERIFSFGDTVVVSARVTVEGKYEDHKLDGEYRHTRVWKKFPDGWKVIAYHASRVEADDDDVAE